jgi:hypothetical protein
LQWHYNVRDVQDTFRPIGAGMYDRRFSLVGNAIRVRMRPIWIALLSLMRRWLTGRGGPA